MGFDYENGSIGDLNVNDVFLPFIDDIGMMWFAHANKMEIVWIRAGNGWLAGLSIFLFMAFFCLFHSLPRVFGFWLEVLYSGNVIAPNSTHRSYS